MEFQAAPTPATANGSSSASAVSGLLRCSNISLPTSTWSLTGRRGQNRKTTTAAASSVPSSDEVLNTNKRKSDKLCDSDAIEAGPHPTTTGSLKRKACFVMRKSIKSNEEGMLEKEYKCNICSKVFSSPRAMGGHMSTHSRRTNSQAPTTTTLTSKRRQQPLQILLPTTMEEPQTTPSLDSTQATVLQEMRMLGFDLNKHLPMVDEEGVIESSFLHL